MNFKCPIKGQLIEKTKKDQKWDTPKRDSLL